MPHRLALPLVVAALASGCPGPPSIVVDAGVAGPRLEIIAPLDGAVLSLADDVDEEEPGLQIDVLVLLHGARGGDLTLRRDGADIATESVEREHVFAGVSLPMTITGVDSRLTVDADGFAAGEVAVTAAYAGSLACEFEEPTPGARIDGLVTDVVIACPFAPGGAEVHVRARSGSEAGTTRSGTLDDLGRATWLDWRVTAPGDWIFEGWLSEDPDARDTIGVRFVDGGADAGMPDP